MIFTILPKIFTQIVYINVDSLWDILYNLSPGHVPKLVTIHHQAVFQKLLVNDGHSHFREGSHLLFHKISIPCK